MLCFEIFSGQETPIPKRIPPHTTEKEPLRYFTRLLVVYVRLMYHLYCLWSVKPLLFVLPHPTKRGPKPKHKRDREDDLTDAEPLVSLSLSTVGGGGGEEMLIEGAEGRGAAVAPAGGVSATVLVFLVPI